MDTARIISIIIAILSAFWLWTDQGYEPLIVCLASISTIAGISFISNKKIRYKYTNGNISSHQKKDELIIKFKDDIELYEYITERITKAKTILDLTFGSGDSHVNVASRDAFLKYRKAIEKTCKEKENLSYHEIMSFPPRDHFEWIEPLINSKLYNYRLHCYIFNEKIDITPVGFMIIDSSELILVLYNSSSYTLSINAHRLLIKHPDIVNLFAEYFNSIWIEAIPLLEGKRVNIEILKKIQQACNK